MLESNSQKDYYEYLFPHERNNVLRGLYQQCRLRQRVPDRSPMTLSFLKTLSQEKLSIIFKRVMDELRRINRSEHRQRLFANLEALLSFAHITTTFKEQIIWDFDMYYLLGTDRDEPNSVSDQEFYLTLDTANPKGAGIFDPHRAQEIERERFHEVWATKNNRGIIVQERLMRWRLDYWKKYKIDPRKR